MEAVEEPEFKGCLLSDWLDGKIENGTEFLFWRPPVEKKYSTLVVGVLGVVWCQR